MDTFFEIALILGLATVLGVVGQKLRQPLIIMFLATGILAGPAGLSIIQSYAQIDLLAKVGIALLLFIVGLKLDLHLIRTTGPVALATGLGQIIFTSAVGLLIALALGLTFLNAAYVAVALTFSSTIIIVKLLSDKNELDSLHGQIAVGFLIVQDIAAILALVVLTTVGSRVDSGTSALTESAVIFLKGTGMLVGVALLGRYVLPHVVRRLARSPEILALFAIAWAVFLAAGGEMLGFSKEVGAFLAGVSLASTGYRDQISVRLTGLRDFLLLFFFIDLGARLDWSTVAEQVAPAMLFSAFVLIGNPIIVMIIMGGMGYRRRTSFMAGLMVAQISEFSLIVAALGLSLGHITPEVMGLITLVGVVTICASTYMILYSEALYRRLSSLLKVFERRHPYREAAVDSVPDASITDIVLFGLGGYGSNLVEFMLGRGKSVLGVDFDVVTLEYWRARNLAVFYGDIADPEVYDHPFISQARWVVSTVRSEELNRELLNNLRRKGYSGKIALTATSETESLVYQNLGAHVVLRPFKDAAEQAADSLSHAMMVMPEAIDWPVAFREVRIQSGAAFAGEMIRSIPLRAMTGVSILAVSRGGRAHHDPGPDFQVFPNDRLLLVGAPDELRRAEELLEQLQSDEKSGESASYAIIEVDVAGDSDRIGRTLVDLQFHQSFGVTVIGIRRGDEQISTPDPREQLQSGDRLIVIGLIDAVRALQQRQPL